MKRAIQMQDAKAGEAGFSLAEALIAILVLIVGILGIANLFAVATSSNAVGNHMTAAATTGSEILEALMARPFDNTFTTGGSLTTDICTVGDCTCGSASTDCPSAFVVPGNFMYRRPVPGVGMMKVNWTIADTGVSGDPTFFITVQAESEAAVIAGRTRVTYTTFRTQNGAPTP